MLSHLPLAAYISCIVVDDFAPIISSNSPRVTTPKCINRPNITICVGCEEIVVQHNEKDSDAYIFIQVGPSCVDGHVNHLRISVRVDLDILWCWLIKKKACCHIPQDLLSYIINYD
jgi:hypothetical protein